jgi:hypothetical protein
MDSTIARSVNVLDSLNTWTVHSKVSKCPRQSKHMDSTIARSVNVLDSLNTWTVQ